MPSLYDQGQVKENRQEDRSVTQREKNNDMEKEKRKEKQLKVKTYRIENI